MLTFIFKKLNYVGCVIFTYIIHVILMQPF